MPLKPCRQTGCPELVGEFDVWCAEHRGEENARTHASSTRGKYRTRKWKLLRLKVFNRDGYQCVWVEKDTGKRCVKMATQVDHLIPVEEGGPMWDEKNLQSLCDRHHGMKTRGEVFARWGT